ncbi:type VII secretion protein EccB [Austwickia chelonae]|uniref:type VII secretion protein EccB n=1 Tax=Austwickia chelonae TaxID=100225 RepID=UPI001F07DFFF|nr:type VII secretion protein EccB [Austwickia chelonae]
MAADRGSTTQVQAYRFGVQRLKEAVATGEAYRRGPHGPRSGMAFLIGVVVASLGLAGMLVYGIIKPAPSVGDATVLVDTDTGVAYVVRDRVLHPATNLTSAMLAAAPPTNGDVPLRRQSEIVRRVNTESISGLSRGSLLGIPDAPGSVPDDAHQLDSRWTVCDETQKDPGGPPQPLPGLQTTVIIGEGGGGVRPGPEVASLVTADRGNTTYLLMDGHRSKVNLRDPKLALGLGIDNTKLRPISLGLLNAIPERPEIVSPSVPDQGKPIQLASRRLAIGDVVRAEQATTGRTYYVVHNDGVQKITSVTADLLRSVTGQHGDIPAVPPSDLSNAKITSHPLDTSPYPAVRPALVDAASAPVLCMDWAAAEGGPQRTIYPTRSMPLPSGVKPVEAPAKETEHSAQRIYVRPGWGLVVGPWPDGATVNDGNPVLITDRGMSFPVADARTLRLLGLGQRVQAVSPELVKLLPQGPGLDTQAALRLAEARGSVPAATKTPGESPSPSTSPSPSASPSASPSPSPGAGSPSPSPSSSSGTTSPSTTARPSPSR